MASDVARRAPNKSNRAATGLRLAGASYGEIAEVLGFASEVEAREAVEADLALQGGDEDGRDRIRTMEGERILRLLRTVWGKATTPTDPEHLSAVKTALSLIDRRIRLYGLDAPQEVMVYTPAASEIDAWVNEMIAQQALPVMEGEIIHDA